MFQKIFSCKVIHLMGFSPIEESQIIIIIKTTLTLSLILCYWEQYVCLHSKSYISFFSNLTNMSDFEPLEVVGRGSGTQHQMGENLNYSVLIVKFDPHSTFGCFSI